MFLVTTLMTMSAMAISQNDFLDWLREGRLHKFTQMGLKLVHVYLQSMGLFKSESCNESSNQQNYQPCRLKVFGAQDDACQVLMYATLVGIFFCSTKMACLHCLNRRLQMLWYVYLALLTGCLTSVLSSWFFCPLYSSSCVLCCHNIDTDNLHSHAIFYVLTVVC